MINNYLDVYRMANVLENQRCWTDGRIWATASLPITIPDKKEGTWDVLLDPRSYPRQVRNEILYPYERIYHQFVDARFQLSERYESWYRNQFGNYHQFRNRRYQLSSHKETWEHSTSLRGSSKKKKQNAKRKRKGKNMFH